MTSPSDRIVKVVELSAPPSRVWRALTDHREFGAWFRVHLDQPFEVGQPSTGHMTYPGYEHYPWRARVEDLEPERLFAFRWYHDDGSGAVPPERQPTTRVEFRLEPLGRGTRLTIVESGFDSFPDASGLEALRRNTEGWNIQAGNIAAHLDAQLDAER